MLLAAVECFMEKCREAAFEENITVCQTSEKDRMTGENQDFSEEDDSEDEQGKYAYESITQKKNGSDTDDLYQMMNYYLETVHR